MGQGLAGATEKPSSSYSVIDQRSPAGGVWPVSKCSNVLTEWLERGSSLPLTLVSAPAGYGKTTLVAQWLADSETPSAWLQLDENDKDLGHFLEHLVAAVRSVYPDALAETKALVAAQVFPPVSIVVRTLLNELDGLVPQRLVLALDDYHAIDSGPVDELLTDLLQHPPRHVHLVLMSRVDPQLPLALLRGRGQLPSSGPTTCAWSRRRRPRSSPQRRATSRTA